MSEKPSTGQKGISTAQLRDALRSGPQQQGSGRGSEAAPQSSGDNSDSKQPANK